MIRERCADSGHALVVLELEREIAFSGDTGIGMDPENVEVARQPFAQVAHRLEQRYEGTGLGLPLTKALVDLHGGEMKIDSARGHGTRITVTFPRAVAARIAEAV